MKKIHAFFTLFTVLLCGVAVCASTSDVNFETFRIEYPGIEYPSDIAYADLDQDGSPDQILTDQEKDSILIRLNTGSGTFTDYSVFHGGYGTSAVVTGDFNQDSFIDIAVSNMDGNNVKVFLQKETGQARFHDASTYPVSNGPIQIVSGDFNQDSNIDLVTLNPNSENISLLVNKGDGTFGGRVNTLLDGVPNDLEIADFNNDDVPDLVVSYTLLTQLSFLKSNGDGTFEFQPFLPLADTSQEISTGDFNNDGLTDCAVLSEQRTSLYLNDNNFEFVQGFTTADSPTKLCLGTGNINNDGFCDFAVVHNDISRLVYLYISDGTGDYTSQTFQAPESSDSIHLYDIDQDSYSDLTMLSWRTNTVTNCLSKSTPGFDSLTGSEIGVGYNFLGQAACGDIDNDSIPDICIVESHENQVIVLTGKDTGYFSNPTAYDIGANPINPVMADFNGDSIVDIAVSCMDSESVSLLINDGFGLFSPAVHYSLGVTAGIASIDVDGDGDIDLASINSEAQQDQITLLINDGFGVFSVGEKLSSKSSGFDDIEIADFDQDGQIDIIALSISHTSVSLFRNIGLGHFDKETTLQSNFILDDIVSGDLNGDSYPDLVGTSSNLNYQVVFLNSHSGQFDILDKVFTKSSFSRLVTGDYNCDGILDLAGLSTAGTTGVLYGLGDGSYVESNIRYGFGVSGADILTMDLDSDGIDDIATIDNFRNSIYPLMNEIDNPTCPDLGVTLKLSQPVFLPGDFFWLKAQVHNHSSETHVDHNLFILLDVGIGIYWFWPTWVDSETGVDWEMISIEPGVQTRTIFEPFPWPDGVGSAKDFIFYGALVDEDVTRIIGEMATVSFSYLE